MTQAIKREQAYSGGLAPNEQKHCHSQQAQEGLLFAEHIESWKPSGGKLEPLSLQSRAGGGGNSIDIVLASAWFAGERATSSGRNDT